MQVLKIALKVLLVIPTCQPINPRCSILLKFKECLFEVIDTDVVEGQDARLVSEEDSLGRIAVATQDNVVGDDDVVGRGLGAGREELDRIGMVSRAWPDIADRVPRHHHVAGACEHQWRGGTRAGFQIWMPETRTS